MERESEPGNEIHGINRKRKGRGRDRDIKRDGWRRIVVQTDSGALDTVTPKDAAPGIMLKETMASKNGIGYVDANGTIIKNYGEKMIKGKTDDGTSVSMAMQCADVTKTLGSVYRMNQGGNAIILDGSNSYMVQKKSGK